MVNSSPKKPRYLNLHAHSDYSLQDGVGNPRDHYLETIAKGHEGCCITDHGSFAAPFELLHISKNTKDDKEIKALLESKGKDSHPIVAGAELYIYDDRSQKKILKDLSQNNFLAISEEIQKLVSNTKFTSLFEQQDLASELLPKDVMDFESKKQKKSDKIGTKLITLLQEVVNGKEEPSEKLKELIAEFANKTSACGSYKYNHITLIAKNPTGHSNLSYLTSISHLPGNYYLRPRISLTDLIENKDGIIATTGCFLGMVPQAIHRNTGEERELFELLKNEFSDDFYVEIHLSDIRWEWDGKAHQWYSKDSNPQEKVNLRLIELIEEFQWWGNTYITQDSHMPKKEDKDQQDLMILSDNNNKNGWHFHDAYPVMTVEEMWEKTKQNCPYLDYDQFFLLCENTLKVQDKCREYSIDKSTKLAAFDHTTRPLGADFRINSPLPVKKETEAVHPIIKKIYENIYDPCKVTSYSPEEIKESLSQIEVLEKRLNEMQIKYRDEYFVQKVLRASQVQPATRVVLRICLQKNKIDFDNKTYRTKFFRELNIIQLNGYNALNPYFTMVEEVSDFIIRKRKIKGAGRGSAAGSVFNYAFDITDVDPVRRNLSFERFLSRERNGFFVIEPIKNGVNDFLKEKGIKTDEFPVEWLNINTWFEKQLNDSKFVNKEELKAYRASKEYEFVTNNPEIMIYLQDLVNNKINKEDNLNNSTTTWILGITCRPGNAVSESKGSMPDIDYDSSCRDEIIKYYIETRGPEKVVLIGTYGTLKVKSAIKEVMRIKLNYRGEPFSMDDQNEITRCYDKIRFSEEELGKGGNWVFEQAQERSQEFNEFFVRNPEIKKYVEKVLGNKKSWGIHAAGVLIADVSIIRQIPCFYDADSGYFVTQIDKDWVEKYGWQKLDLLGLSTLEEVEDTFNRIIAAGGPDYFGSMERLVNLEDPKVLEMFKRDPMGIFQFGTKDPTSHFKAQKKEVVFPDCPLVTSMYRPGPMGAKVPQLILKKMNGELLVTYEIPQLEPILSKTYGEIIYQEQIMLICQEIGGMTPFESDDVRRAMGKKKMKLLEPYEKRFIDYAVNVLGIEPSKAIALWGKMAKFAEYGFNESHAVAYAYLSYIQMFLKVYHTQHWIASVLSRASKNDTPKDKENFKKFYRKYADMIKSPTVKYSKDDYVVAGDKIITPLFAIAGVGEETGKEIIRRGPFGSFEEYCIKCQSVNDKKVTQMLSLSGAFDDYMDVITEAKLDKVTNKLFLNFITKVVLKDELTEEEEAYLKVQMNHLDIGLIDQLPDDVLEIEPLQKAWNKYNFRKFLTSYYSLSIESLEFTKEFKEEMKETLGLAEKEIIETNSNKAVEKHALNYSIIEQRKIPADSKKKPSKKKHIKFRIYDDALNMLVSRGEDANVGDKKDIDKVLELIDLSNGKMIIRELSALKIATFDSNETTKTAVEYAQEKFFKNERIYKTEELGAIVERNMEILTPIYDSLHASKINALRTKNLLSTCETGYYAVLLRTLMGNYETKNIFSDLIKSVQENAEVRDNLLATVSLLLPSEAYRDLWKTNVRVKLKSIVDKGAYDFFHSLAFQRPVTTLQEANVQMEFMIPFTGLVQALISRYVLMNGHEGAKKLTAIGVNPKSLKTPIEAIGKYKINRENIDQFRAKLEIIDFGCDFGIIADQLQQMNSEDSFGTSDFVKFERDVLVTGNVFRPDKKKEFKKERYNNYSQNVENRMSFKLANDQTEFPVTAFNSDSYSTFVNNKKMNLEEAIIDYHPIILRTSIKYNIERAQVDLWLSKGDSDIFYPLINYI